MNPYLVGSTTQVKHLQLEKLRLQLLFLRRSLVLSPRLPARRRHLLHKRLCEVGQGAAAATQAQLVGLLVLPVVRDGQPGQLLLHSRQDRAHSGGPLTGLQAKQRWRTRRVSLARMCNRGSRRHYF